jgi:hypothetical protein
MRLVLMWRNDSSTSTQPPAAIDDVTLVSSQPGILHQLLLKLGTASTWDANAVPSTVDNVIVDIGHNLTIDAANQGSNNLVLKGTLAYGTTPTSFSVNGNLNVNSGGTFNVFNGTTGKALSVMGNILMMGYN